MNKCAIDLPLQAFTHDLELGALGARVLPRLALSAKRRRASAAAARDTTSTDGGALGAAARLSYRPLEPAYLRRASAGYGKSRWSRQAYMPCAADALGHALVPGA